ncbi:MAG: DEAD/DEAH box helicase [Cellulomonadaceae bacterium]|nr:DEAD/DEAH box helicase [Cellulomonadaceae bacterium]
MPEDNQTSVTFDDLGLPESLRTAVSDLGYTDPTAIQAGAIPALLAGHDIIGVAQTGTGKTAAFALPLLNTVDVARPVVQALVLTPTRELAIQVAEAIQEYAHTIDGLRVLPVYGGAPYPPQIRALRDGVHVVVGTPGRVMDHMDRGALDLSDATFLVLDEGDEMLRMGFAEDVETIFAGAPTERQVALFSATMPPAIRRIADAHLTDPVNISVTPQASTVDTVVQTYAVVPFRHKMGAVTRVLSTTDAEATIVFCRTRAAAEEVGSALVERGIAAATISGDVPQKERERIVERLRSGALDVLVATDVAARGLDVDRVGLVINFDLPREPEAYVHRVGRTGRAGRSGVALSFINPHERGKLKHIENTIKMHLDEVDIPSPRDVSAHKAAAVLAQVPARVANGRLDLYADLVRTALNSDDDAAGTGASGTDATVSDPLELAAALLALAVGDDGPRLRREQEEYEAEAERTRAARQARELRAAAADQRRGDRADRWAERGDRRGERPERVRTERVGDRGARGSDRFSDRYSDGYADRPDRRTSHDASAGPRSTRGAGIRRPAQGTRYRVSVGHKDGVNPGGIVGAITGEGGLSGADIGKIDIFPTFSLVDVLVPLDKDQMKRIAKAPVAGRALRITPDKGAPTGFREPKFGESKRFGDAKRSDKRFGERKSFRKPRH